MALASLIRPEMREIGGVYKGVLRGAAIGSGELKTLLERVEVSAEILIDKNEKEHAAKWPERLLLGQHFNGQTGASGVLVGHAYELRGRLFMQST
ncbi:MAG: hypothetical protein IJD04_08665 [Desulfovibrionaceae bacterium]|nr:hypothetical protein [Desulfovibrionaceae bacterium]